MRNPFFLESFRALHPPSLVSQEESASWLAAAHTRANATAAAAAQQPFDETEFHQRIVRRLARFGCGPDKIRQRGVAIADCTHTRWEAMQVYRLHERPEGEGMLTRTRAFAEASRAAFEGLYAAQDAPPSDLLHVTCTGYESPSAAQRFVAERGWGRQSRVTHAYHMGCYAALPALRVAAGLVSAASSLRLGGSRRADIVHTEVCSLHVNPMLQTPEQLVIQTLFADGFIAYSVCDALSSSDPALEILALAEEVVPDSASAMNWVCSDWGMQMTLARDVPERIQSPLASFVARLCSSAELSTREREQALFAVHPGGPRILDQVRDGLALVEDQIGKSRDVLALRGNMSSATLPHVWLELLGDARVREGQPIISLAFGPGLTLSGAVLRKVAR